MLKLIGKIIEKEFWEKQNSKIPSMRAFQFVTVSLFHKHAENKNSCNKKGVRALETEKKKLRVYVRN
jgi:hypothetical protein